MKISKEKKLRRLIRSEISKKWRRNLLDIAVVLSVLFIASSLFYIGWAVQRGKFIDRTVEIHSITEKIIITANESCQSFRDNLNPKEFKIVCD